MPRRATPPTPSPPMVTPRRATPTSPPAPVASRPIHASSSSGMMLPLPPQANVGPIPQTPVDTLRGVVISRTRDSGRIYAGAAAGAAGIEARSERREFDPARVAQRDAMVRRLVWVGIVIASLLGLVLAARL